MFWHKFRYCCTRNVYTTDRQGSAGYNTSAGIAGNYYCCFGGTSAACPHVAGVAALILSINPTLTQKQVRDIIESTARKVGSYSYATTTGRPNGTWNNEMGYGLIDAYEACKKACKVELHSITIDPSAQINACTIDVKNATVPTGKTLELKATEKLTINDGFEVFGTFVVW